MHDPNPNYADLRPMELPLPSPGRSFDDPFVGRTISHYELTDRIGGGGMGDVYRARDSKLGRLVALKFLPSSLSRDERAKNRFVREARAASAIEHPNICTVYEIDETSDGQLFIAMAYISGETLAAKLENGPLPVEEAVEYGVQITRALERAHTQGIVHRDVKPANVMIDEENTVRLLDFGLASLAGDSAMTRAGTIMGTSYYMSPEQVRGERGDHRSDIWSLGVTMYEMLAGRRPFEAAYPQAVFYSILNVDPEPLSSCSDSSVAAAVMKALTKNPSDRHPNAKAFRQALERRGDRRPAHRARSILVLPFDDVSPNHDNQYFSEGISEELISELSQIGSLRVICRTSAWQAKAAGKDIATMRRELDIDYILEGSVRKSGNRIRITPQLIDAASQSTMWSGKHDGILEDIFDIQDRVAHATVEALKLRLSDDEEERMGRRLLPNARAYELYLRARREIYQYTHASLRRALRHLRDGIDIVGANAVLYSGIGYVHWTYANLGVDRKENLTAARSYAERAFDLEPDLAPTQRVIGLIAALEGDQHEAILRLRRAIELDPNDLETLHWLRTMYGYVGKTAEAWPLAAREMSVDPLNPVSQAAAGWLHFMEGDFELALEPYRRMLETDPENPAFIYFYVQALAYTGRVEEACAQIDALVENMPQHPYAWMCRCFMHALAGDPAALADSMTPELEKMARADLSHAWFMADCYALVGAEEEAISWLETAVRMGFVNYPFLARSDPFLKPLRGKNRFERLMEHVKEEWDGF